MVQCSASVSRRCRAAVAVPAILSRGRSGEPETAGGRRCIDFGQQANCWINSVGWPAFVEGKKWSRPVTMTEGVEGRYEGVKEL